MHRPVRLTRRVGGGFRLEGVEAAPIEATPAQDGLIVGGAGNWTLSFDSSERGWILRRPDGPDGPSTEAGRTTGESPSTVVAPVSVLLPDGRLFRLAVHGLTEPRVELARWDGPGAYVVGRPVHDGWELERTAAGTALDAPPELWVLIAVELGRLDGWH